MVSLFSLIIHCMFAGFLWLGIFLPVAGFYLWRLGRGMYPWQWQQVFEFGNGPWLLSHKGAAARTISRIRVDRVWLAAVIMQVQIDGRWQWLVLSADRTTDADALRQLRILLREVYTGREYSVEGTGQEPRVVE